MYKKYLALLTLVASVSCMAQPGLIEGVEVGYQSLDFDYSEMIRGLERAVGSIGESQGVTLRYYQPVTTHVWAEWFAEQIHGYSNYTGGVIGDDGSHQKLFIYDEGHREYSLAVQAHVMMPQTNAFTLVPHFGLAYRNFFQDTSGQGTWYQGRWITTYSRKTQYYLLPVGVDGYWQLHPHWQVQLSGTFHYLITGFQTSYMSNLDPRFPDIRQKQDNGYGMKMAATVRYQYDQSQIGLTTFVQHYQIDDSRTKEVGGGGWVEPKNHTRVAGIVLTYLF